VFLLSIDTDGDAFADGNALRETARIVDVIARAIARDDDTQELVVTARDVNGNTCAIARYSPEPETAPDVCECGAARLPCGHCGADGFACATHCGHCGRAR
jgi:hypothetical protein